MVVGDVPDRYALPERLTFENSVTGVRSSDVNLMKDRYVAIVSRATNTPGVDDKPAISQPDNARNVRVSAQDQ